MSPWDRLNGLLVRHRVASVAAALLLTAICLPLAPAIPFSGDITNYLPRNDKYVKFWLDMSRRFDAMNVLVVGLEEPSGAMTTDGLARLDRLTRRLGGMKAQGVLLSQSIANIETTSEGADGTLNAEMLMAGPPGDAAALGAFAARLRADTQVRGALVSRDLSSYLIILRADARKDVRVVAQAIQAASEEERGPLNAYYFGVPYFSSVVTSRVYAKLTWIVPLFVLLLLLPLAWRIRRAGAIALVLFSAAAPIVWWLVLMRLLGQQLTVTSLNTILVFTAAAAVVFGRAAERRSHDPAAAPFPARLAIGLSAAACACYIASHVVIPYLSQFCAALAAGFAALVAFGLLFFAPAASWLSPAAPRGPGPTVTPGSALLAGAILLVTGLYGATQIEFHLAPQDMFAKDDEVGRMIAFFDRRFGGNDLIQVDVQGDLRDPANAARLMRFTDLVEGSGHFADTRSISQVLGFLGGGFAGSHRIPSTREALGNLWFFLEGRSDAKSLANEARSEAMVVVRIPSRPAMRPGLLADFLRDAAARSKDLGSDPAARRIEALAKLHGVPVDRSRLVAALDGADRPALPGVSAVVSDRVIERLHAWLASPEAPIALDEERWSRIADAIRSDATGLRTRLGEALAGQVGATRQSIAHQVEMLLTREADLRVAVRSAMHAGRIWADPAQAPEPLRARVEGVIAELIAPPPGNGAELEFRVSGFPILARGIAEDVRAGIFVAAFLLIAALASFLLIFTMDLGLAAKGAAEAVLASLSTFALGWALGVQIDAGSGTLYLLPPLVTFLASGWLLRAPGERVPRHERYAGAAMTGLALAALTLLVSGILPAMRIGAVMATGLAMITAVTAVSARVRSGDA